MSKVLVGTDGSVSGQAAVAWAVEFAHATGAELVIAHVWAPPFAEVAPETDDELRREAARVLEDEWSVPARERDVAHRTVLLEGDPRSALLDAASELDVDLVVVGARGAGSHPHTLHLGSVTHHLVHHTNIPLAAVPPSARAA